MSTCISQFGEYGRHDLGTDYVCARCGVLAEEALIEDLHTLRRELHAAQIEMATEREAERLRGYERAIEVLRAKDAEVAERFAREAPKDPYWDGWPYGHHFRDAADLLESLAASPAEGEEK